MHVRQPASRITTVFVFLLLIVSCRQTPEIPAIVIGDSMAPTLFGAHWLATCNECKIPFKFCDTKPASFDISTNSSLTPPNIVCPNCGFRNEHLDRCSAENATPVAVHPSTKISRWDIVAFQIPNTETAGIKRVVGLPKECIEIRHGDLFKQNTILRKPIKIQKQLRIPVFDSAYRPCSNLPDRWHPTSNNSCWSISPSFFKYKSLKDNSAQPIFDRSDCLVYDHWRCCAHLAQRDQIFAIEDIDFYNQGLPRDLNSTDDLWLEIELEKSEDSKFGWRFFRGSILSEFVLDFRQHQLATRIVGTDQSILESTTTTLPNLSSPTVKVEFSSFDAELLVMINGEKVYGKKMDPTYQSVAVRPLQIMAAHGELRVNRIRIWRDIFYLPGPDDVPLTAPKEHFVLLGDNASVSIDSRNWKQTGVARGSIIGIVKK